MRQFITRALKMFRAAINYQERVSVLHERAEATALVAAANLTVGVLRASLTGNVAKDEKEMLLAEADRLQTAVALYLATILPPMPAHHNSLQGPDLGAHVGAHVGAQWRGT